MERPLPRQARNVPSFATTVIRHLLLSAGFWLVASLAFAEDFPTFEYHEIARIGNHMGQTSLVDLDKDGHNDVVMTDCDTEIGPRRVHWFRNQDGKVISCSGSSPVHQSGPLGRT